MINSKLEYGLIIYGGAYQSSIQPLVILQKACMRIVLYKNKLEYAAPWFKRLKLLPLKNLYIFQMLRAF